MAVEGGKRRAGDGEGCDRLIVNCDSASGRRHKPASEMESASGWNFPRRSGAAEKEQQGCSCARASPLTFPSRPPEIQTRLRRIASTHLLEDTI